MCEKSAALQQTDDWYRSIAIFPNCVQICSYLLEFAESDWLASSAVPSNENTKQCQTALVTGAASALKPRTPIKMSQQLIWEPLSDLATVKPLLSLPMNNQAHSETTVFDPIHFQGILPLLLIPIYEATSWPKSQPLGLTKVTLIAAVLLTGTRSVSLTTNTSFVGLGLWYCWLAIHTARVHYQRHQRGQYYGCTANHSGICCGGF